MTIEHARIKTYNRAKGHSEIAVPAYRGGFLPIDQIGYQACKAKGQGVHLLRPRRHRL